MYCSRHSTSLVGFLLIIALLAMPRSAAYAANEEPPISLISFDGVRPAPLAAVDPLSESIGVLFVSPEAYVQRTPMTDGYATAFLVSECHALVGTAVVTELPITGKMTGGSVVELPGLRFGIGLKPGSDPGALTEGSFRASWPVTAHYVVPDELNRSLFELAPWWLLRLEGCKPGAKDNGRPITFDPITSLELQEAGLPRKARHVGALMTEGLALMEVPCNVFGQMRGHGWESTCSSWLGMQGGPVLTFDPDKNTWIAVGFIPAGNIGLLLNPSESMASGKRNFDVYSVDEKNPRYFHYTTQVTPMAQVWPWIIDSIEQDNPGLVHPARAGVAELETDLRKSLLMQMQQRPKSAWSAFDYTRFGMGLESIGYEADAAEFFKAAIAADPSYLPAAFRLSDSIGDLGPTAISDQELKIVLSALDAAVAKYPEDPQLILHRLAVEKRMALHKEVLADAEKYMAESQFPAPAWLSSEQGMAYLALGDLDRAEAALAKAIELDAADIDAIRSMASVKLQRGDVDDGVRRARKAVRTDPDDQRARTVLALALARSGNIDGGIAVLEEASDKFAWDPTPLAYVAVLRGYKRARAGDTSDDALLDFEEIAGTSETLWPRQMVDVFAGLRSVESIGTFDYSAYRPDWRRSIDIGRLVFAAAFDLSQGRTIDYAALEQSLMKYRDLNFVHLAPILKEWSEIVAARKQ
jgi:tetratricopeptide (TPR) repeat protein